MPIAEIKKIVKKYVKKLKSTEYPVHAAYLFGSQIKGSAHKDSDIDVAIVSNKLLRNKDKNRLKLWQLKMTVDLRIEPHGFTIEEFKSKEDPMVHEIKTTGVRVV